VRPGNPQKPLFIAGLCALLTYTVVGNLTPFDALHYVVGAHAGQHAPWTNEIQRHLDRYDRIRPAPRGAPSAAADGAEQRSLPPFDGIVLGSGANATIVIGDAAAVTVEGGGKDVGKVSTVVENGELVVGSAKGQARLKVTLPHLRSLRIDGTGNTEVSGLRDPISIVVSGPGNLKASGDVDSLDLVVSGPGNFELSRLQAKDAKILLMGPGRAAVFATRNLNATVLGPGTIRYLGDPEVTQNILGPGFVGRISQG
jgi:hypothetical protein